MSRRSWKISWGGRSPGCATSGAHFLDVLYLVVCGFLKRSRGVSLNMKQKMSEMPLLNSLWSFLSPSLLPFKLKCSWCLTLVFSHNRIGNLWKGKIHSYDDKTQMIRWKCFLFRIAECYYCHCFPSYFYWLVIIISWLIFPGWLTFGTYVYFVQHIHGTCPK